MRAVGWSRAVVLAVVLLSMCGATRAASAAAGAVPAASIEPIDPQHQYDDPRLSGPNAPSGGVEPNGQPSGGGSSLLVTVIIFGAIAGFVLFMVVRNR
jgi:hypothetical protein